MVAWCLHLDRQGSLMICICVLRLEISAPAATDIHSLLLQGPFLPPALCSLRLLLLLWFIQYMATSWPAKDLSRRTHILQPTHTAATHSMLAHRIASLAISSHRHKVGATYIPTSPCSTMSEHAFHCLDGEHTRAKVVSMDIFF